MNLLTKWKFIVKEKKSWEGTFKKVVLLKKPSHLSPHFLASLFSQITLKS